MIINRANSVNQNLFNLIKASNPLVTLDDLKVQVGVPEAGSFVGGRNTKITVSSIKNKGFKGTRDLFYTRPQLTTGLSGAITTILPNVGETIGQLGSRILAALNIVESEVIINGGSGWALTGNNVMVAKANSVLYAPGATWTVNAQSITGNGPINIVLGTYSALSYKATIRTTYYSTGVITTAIGIDLDSAHSPAPGNMVGSITSDPSDMFARIQAAIDPTYATFLLKLTYKLTTVPLPANITVKFTNLDNGLTSTLAFVKDTYTSTHQNYYLVDQSNEPANFRTLFLVSGARINIEIL